MTKKQEINTHFESLSVRVLQCPHGIGVFDVSAFAPDAVFRVLATYIKLSGVSGLHTPVFLLKGPGGAIVQQVSSRRSKLGGVMLSLFVFFIGCCLTLTFVFNVVTPFVIAHPQVIIPGAIGGALGFIGSAFSVVKWESDLIWDFLLAVGLPPCVGIALGLVVGLLL